MAAVVLTAALVFPIHAHTVDELQAWEQDWNSRVEQLGWVLTPELAEEWADIHANHAWYYRPALEQSAPPPQHLVPISPSTNSGMGNGNVEQWRSLVAAYFPPDQVDRALSIMACESGGNPNAYNPSGATGLMQVLASWADNFGLVPSQLFDPATNLQVARYLYDDAGWSHWVCQP